VVRCRPEAARVLVTALKGKRSACQSTSIHTTRAALPLPSVLAAIDAGAMRLIARSDSIERPHVTAQHGIDYRGVCVSDPWLPESIRPNTAVVLLLGTDTQLYGAFESDIRSGASEVYVHGMPGGQYTQPARTARSLGIDETRWPEVAQTYSEV